MVLLGLLEIETGILLALNARTLTDRLGLPEEFISHFSIGFIAAGILTGTVETISNYLIHRQVEHAARETRRWTLRAIRRTTTITQRSIARLESVAKSNALKIETATNDTREALESVTRSLETRILESVSALQQSTVETVLRNIFPGGMFDEVKEQLVTRPFVRSEYQAHLTLEPRDDDRLLQLTSIDYVLTNTSMYHQIFDLRVGEGWIEGIDPPAHIEAVQLSRTTRPEIEDLTSEVKLLSGRTALQKDVMFGPGESMKVSVRTVRFPKPDDSYPIHFSHATSVSEISITHPDEISVALAVFHPASHRLTARTVRYHTTWTFAPRFLPFQGCQVGWTSPQRKKARDRVRTEKI